MSSNAATQRSGERLEAIRSQLDVARSMYPASMPAPLFDDLAWLLAEVEARDERIALLRAEVTDIERRLRIFTEVKS
jgi:hypothetical protein